MLPYDYNAAFIKCQERAKKVIEAKNQAEQDVKRIEEERLVKEHDVKIKAFSNLLHAARCALQNALDKELLSFGYDSTKPNEGVITFTPDIAKDVDELLRGTLIREPDLAQFT